MDCGFVLAEELYFRDHYYEAFLLLEQIIREEQKQAYFRHFFPEVLILARKLIREKLIYTLSDDLMLDCCEAALDFGLSKADNAEILKKWRKFITGWAILVPATGAQRLRYG